MVDVRGVGAVMAAGGGSLLGDGEVPDGRYAEESMRRTIVPNRNLIMLAIAGGIARARGIDAVATAEFGGFIRTCPYPGVDPGRRRASPVWIVVLFILMAVVLVVVIPALLIAAVFAQGILTRW